MPSYGHRRMRWSPDFVESFYKKPHDGCLNENLLCQFAEAIEALESWWIDEDAEPPPSAIGNRMPAGVASANALSMHRCQALRHSRDGTSCQLNGQIHSTNRL
jgi:hypothetical protein